MKCTSCKHWNNSEIVTQWNKQNNEYMDYDYLEYGECSCVDMMKSTFFDISQFGNYTHKSFGCTFIKNN